jgi:hypothetical protein
MSALNLWVEAFELDAGFLSRELPVNALLRRVAPLFPLCGFVDECLPIGDPAIQTL